MGAPVSIPGSPSGSPGGGGGPGPGPPPVSPGGGGNGPKNGGDPSRGGNPPNPSPDGDDTGGPSDASPAFVAGTVNNAASIAAGVGEYSNVRNGKWRGEKTLKDGTRRWYKQNFRGSGSVGGRTAVLQRAAAFNLAGKAFFGVGVALSLAEAGSGNISPAQMALDIGMGALGTFGGPPGFVIAGTYFATQAILASRGTSLGEVGSSLLGY